MKWLRRARRQNAAPEAFARILYQVYVQDPSGKDEFLERDWIPPVIGPGYLAKVELYRKAVLLMALISEAQQHPEFEPVLGSYEALLFEPTPNAAGLEGLEVLKSAMTDLRRLLDLANETEKITTLELCDPSSGTFASKGNLTTPFVWAMDWFREIGHEENNPVTLMAFARSWMDEYVSVAEALKRYSLS